MTRANEAIKRTLASKGLTQWRLAEVLGISECTLCRKLRKELTTEEKEKLLKLINELEA